MSTRQEPEPYPGPWAWEYNVDTNRPIALVSRSGDVLLPAVNGSFLWVMVSPTHQALLAAAPDLLDAARLARDAIALHSEYPPHPGIMEAMAALRAAIAKAEG